MHQSNPMVVSNVVSLAIMLTTALSATNRHLRRATIRGMIRTPLLVDLRRTKHRRTRIEEGLITSQRNQVLRMLTWCMICFLSTPYLLQFYLTLEHRICDGTSQVIRPTYSCPCPTDLRQPCRCPLNHLTSSVSTFLTFPRSVSPVT
jgi:hypothetical protein